MCLCVYARTLGWFLTCDVCGGGDKLHIEMGGDYRDLQKFLSRYPFGLLLCVFMLQCVYVSLMYQLGVQEQEQRAVSE